MTNAHTELQSIASLFYAICNQNKEKRARLLNKLSKYGQKLAHRTRCNTVLTYTKRRRSQLNKKSILTTRTTPSLIVEEMEDLCCRKKNPTRLINRKKGTILISPQPQTGGKANRIIQLNPIKERSPGATQGGERRACPEEASPRNAGTGSRNLEAITERERSLGADIAGTDPGPRITRTKTPHPYPGANEGRDNLGSAQEKQRSPEADQGNSTNAGTYLAGRDQGSHRNPHKIEMQENEDDRNVKKQPIILLEQISTQKIKKQEEHLGKNETIPKECQPYIREAKENTNDAEDSVVFAKEIEQLDADDKEVNSGKIMKKAKQPRTDNITKMKKQEEYKKLQWIKIEHSTSKNNGKKRKRQNIIESSSEDDEWQPSEEDISTDDETYSEKSANKQKFSRTKQTHDNSEKHRFEAQHSTTKQKLSTKKQRNDNSEKYDFEPQQSTSTQSTFLMDIQNQKPKKNKAKKSQKSREYAPPEKQKKREEVEIPKHIFTVMTQKLKEKKVDKSHVKPEKEEWKGTAAERKRIAVLYHHIPDNLKSLMRQNIELTDDEQLLVEGKMRKEANGRFKCLDCSERSFLKKRELYHHVRIIHSQASIMHVCGYGDCNIANNNTTLLGVHTVHAHFAHLFKNINIPV